MRRHVALVSGLLAVMAILAVMAVPVSAGSDPPTVSIGRDRVAPSDRLQVRGDQWPVGDLVNLELCGNDGLDATLDCDLRNSSEFVVRESGEFFGAITIEVPPKPCPCVIRVTGQNVAEAVTVPIDFPSAGFVAAEQRVPDADVAAVVEITSLDIRNVSDWSSWFGAPADRTGEVVVTNAGNVALTDLTLILTIGRGQDPADLVASRDIGTIEPGETITMTVPFELPTLSFDRYTTRASIEGLGTEVVARSQTSTYPWALIVLGLVGAQSALLIVRNRLRRRLGRRDEPTAEHGDPADLERQLPPDDLEVLPPGELVDLTDPRGPLVADPYEPDTARAIAASSALAVRLRRETDVALMDHHEQAAELAADLQRDGEAQAALLQSSVIDAHDHLTEAISSTREQAHNVAATAAGEAQALLQAARAHRDAARAVFDEAAAHANIVIGAAEKQSIRFERAEEQWRMEEAAVTERHHAQLGELEQLETRLWELRSQLEERAMAISVDSTLRSQMLIERAASTEGELRDEAHRSLVDIVTRSAQVSATQVFAAASSPDPLQQTDLHPEPVETTGPAHVNQIRRRRRFWQHRPGRETSVRRTGT